MFRMHFRTDNAAFENRTASESAKILRAIADNLDSGGTSGTIRDVNGNTIGSWSIERPRKRASR